MLKIVVACANGAGSSLLMAMKVKEVLKSLNVNADVKHCPISEATSTATRYDAVITAVNFLNSFKRAQNAGVKVIGIRNILSAAEIKEKILESGLIP